MDFSKTLIRCSSLGSIMGGLKGYTPMQAYLNKLELLEQERAKYAEIANKESKSAVKKLAKIQEIESIIPELEKNKDTEYLSKCCEAYLIKTYALEKYNRIKDITTKEMVKGIEVEDDSIDLFSKMEGKKYEKNSYKLSNGYISGTLDLFDGESIDKAERVIDIKSSYDIETFLKNVTAPIPASYYWQLQGYMMLTGAKTGTIAYCLVNTPESIINQEKLYLMRKLDVATEDNPLFIKEAAKLERNMRFDDIPIEERIIRVSIDRNEEDMVRILNKVEKCREYLASFQEKHLFFTKNYRKDRLSEIDTELE